MAGLRRGQLLLVAFTMRITKLELTNFRTFSHLLLEDLPDFLLLVSPNGGGKSSILEAIAGVKDIVVPYQGDRYQVTVPRDGKNELAWPDHLREPIRLGAAEATITLEVEPRADERTQLETMRLGDGVGRASVTIRNGRLIVDRKATPTIEALFKYHNPKAGFGYLDYIRPHRYFGRQEIGDPTQPTNDSMIRGVFSDFLQNWQNQPKFNSFKNFVVSSDLGDHSHRKKTGEDRDSLAPLREVFDQFFAPKKFLGYNTTPRDEPQVAVITPWGEHDIDIMSDGEKELLHVLGHLYRFRSLHNVVLWDTPEAHLNAALESRLYDGLRMVAPNNQFWLATHSLELIGATPVENVVVLRNTADGTRAERPAPARRARIELYRELGAQVGLQLIASRLAFIEGQDDERILRYLADISPAVRFADSSGVRSLKGVIALLMDASEDENFCAICDRDDMTDAELEAAERKASGRLHIWRQREIENYLLDETAIWAVLQDWRSLRYRAGCQFHSEADVLAALTRAADKTKAHVVAKKVAHRLNAHIAAIKVDPQNIEQSVTTAIERRKALFAYADQQEQRKLISQVHTEVDRDWAVAWKSECVGKETLGFFLHDNFDGANDAIARTFVERLCKQMRTSGRVPTEVAQVIRLISEGNAQAVTPAGHPA